METVDKRTLYPSSGRLVGPLHFYSAIGALVWNDLG